MATRRKYIREVNQAEKVDENVIRVSQRTMATNFVRRAIWLLSEKKEGEGQEQGQQYDTIILKAIENAIPKALIVSEVIRRRIPGLYQIDTIGQSTIEEIYKPTEEGLLEVKLQKRLATLDIKLTTKPSEQDRKAPGFHEPLPESEIQKERPQREGGSRGGRGQRRGGYDRRRDDRDGGRRRDDRDGSRRRDDRDGGDRRRDDRDGSRRRDDRDGESRRRDDRDGSRRRDDRDGESRRRDDRDGRRDDRDGRRDDRGGRRDDRGDRGGRRDDRGGRRGDRGDRGGRRDDGNKSREERPEERPAGQRRGGNQQE